MPEPANEPAPPDTGLEFFTNEQLLGELQRRFSNVLFVAGRPHDSETFEHYAYWRGSNSSALGLAEYAKEKIKIRIRKPGRRAEGD